MSMFDLHTNFAKSLVATPPSPAISGTSLTLTTGEGALFPTGTFNVVVWPIGEQPTAANAEIARATRTGDVLAIVRAQESSAARTIITGDQVMAALTAKTLTDIENNTGWVLIATQAVGVAVTEYDFPNLGDYSEILVHIDDIARSAAVSSALQLSSDNGSSFYAGATDYSHIASTGIETDAPSVAFFQTGATAARSGAIHVRAFNVAGSPKPMTLSITSFPTALMTQTAAMNAVRVSQSSGTMTGGTIYVWGRR